MGRRNLEPSLGELMNKYEAETGIELETGKPLKSDTVSRDEFNALAEQVFRLNKTLEGMQQLFIKAGEYQGKPRGRLPR